MMEKLVIVIPAYNEEENIRWLVRSWYAAVSSVVEGEGDFEIVVIDDGSKDRTYEVLCNLKSKFPKLSVLTKANGGHGAAVLYGYRYAIEHGADYIFQTDSDGQTNPKEFGAFWTLRHKYDAVIGNRTSRKDGKSRIFVEKVVCLLLKIYFGVNVPDANAPFRLMKTDIVKKYIVKLPRDYFLPNIMLTAYFSFYHENIVFREISFRARQAGTNSINLKRIFHIGWEAIHDYRDFRRDMLLEYEMMQQKQKDFQYTNKGGGVKMHEYNWKLC